LQNLKSAISNRKSKVILGCRVVARRVYIGKAKRVRVRHGYGATAPKAFGAGGKGIRTPDFQLAKLALYQLSYAPEGIAEFRLPIFDCKEEKKNAGCRSYESASGIRALLRTGEAAFVRYEKRPCFPFVSVPQQVPPNTPLTRP